ncbi:MAG: hypothetical protein WBA12_13630 [Catalinimonas sp.]
MPNRTLQKFSRLLLTVLNSIGFRTTILALVFLVVSISMVWVEQTLDLTFFTDAAQFWLIQDHKKRPLRDVEGVFT